MLSQSSLVSDREPELSEGAVQPAGLPAVEDLWLIFVLCM